LRGVVLGGAMQGVGILNAYDHDGVDQALAAGRLKRVLADWSPISPGLFLDCSNRHHPPPALRTFIECLLDERSEKQVESGRSAKAPIHVGPELAARNDGKLSLGQHLPWCA